MTYEVLSDRLPWQRGATVRASQLRGCNIAALVDAGHIAPVAVKQTKTKKASIAKEQEAWPASS